MASSRLSGRPSSKVLASWSIEMEKAGLTGQEAAMGKAASAPREDSPNHQWLDPTRHNDSSPRMPRVVDPAQAMQGSLIHSSATNHSSGRLSFPEHTFSSTSVRPSFVQQSIGPSAIGMHSRNFHDLIDEMRDHLRYSTLLLDGICHQHDFEVAKLSTGQGGLGGVGKVVSGIETPPLRNSISQHSSLVTADSALHNRVRRQRKQEHAEQGAGVAGTVESMPSLTEATIVATTSAISSITPTISLRKLTIKIKDGYTASYDKKKAPSTAPGSHIQTEVLDLNAHPSYMGLHPDSPVVTAFEACGMMCFMWDTFAVPWYLAMFRSSDTFLWSASWVTRMFWLLDMIINFGIGYLSEDFQLEMRLRQCVKRYLRGWFAFDLSIVIADFVFASLGKDWPERHNGDETRYPRSVFLHCMLGAFMLRMARQCMRIPSVIEKARMMRRRKSGSLPVWLDMLIILSMILALNHSLSCIWIIMGETSSNVGSIGHHDGQSWLQALVENAHVGCDPTDSDCSGMVHGAHGEMHLHRGYIYMTALHWALTQMTPGSMEVVPRSTAERAYNVMVLMLGLVVGPVMTATIVSMMTEKRLRIQDRTRRFLQLQQFLHQEQVERSLSIAINRKVKERLKEKRRVILTEVKDIELLPRSMKDKLTYNVYGKCIMKHGFFNILNTFDPGAVMAICSQTMKPMLQVSGELVFEAGQSGDSMYFVQSGFLQYFPGMVSAEARRGIADIIPISTGEYCSEAALWVQWCYLGVMKAGSTSDLLRINDKDFQRDLARYPAAFAITCEFCRSFFVYYESARSRWSDIGHDIDHSEIFATLSHEPRMAIADAILAELHKKDDNPLSFFRGQKEDSSQMRNLRDEITRGKCFISIYEGEVVRTVSVVALQARRADDTGIFLTQIGTKKGNVIKASVVLPGKKRAGQEPAPETMKRCILEDLPKMKDMVDMDNWVSEELCTFKESPTYGIRTRYLRTEFTVDLDTPDHALQRIRAPGKDFVAEMRALDSNHSRKGGVALSSRMRGCFSCCKHRAEDALLQAKSGSSNSRSNGLSHNNSRGNAVVAESILQDKDVAMISPNPNGGVTAFLWVTNFEMEILSSRNCESLLRQFLEQLRLDDPILVEAPAADEDEEVVELVDRGDDELCTSASDQLVITPGPAEDGRVSRI